MKRPIVTLLFLMMAAAAVCYAAESPNQLFYVGNAHYQKGEYNKAVESYLKVIDTGIESGNLYYNIGNGFFKLGKLGYAILCYERAKRLVPRDSDLKSNLTFVRTLIDEPDRPETLRRIIAHAAARPYKYLTVSGIAVLGVWLYLLVAALGAINIANPVFGRKTKILFIAFIFVLSATVVAFGVRFYEERIVRRAVILEKSVEAKYEPIEKSTTYFALKEGARVRIMKEKDDWRRVRRADGKAGWVRKEAVEAI